MIDYEKLKLAHELSEKYAKEMPTSCSLRISYCHNNPLKIYWEQTRQREVEIYDNIDELIIRLQDINKINCKYKIGQKVWMLNDEYEPESFVIANVDYDSKEKYFLDNTDHWWIEEQIYPTREALIESQIEHWQKLKNDKMTPEFEGEVIGFKCQHEYDGVLYANPPFPPNRKCKKCGEFY